MLRLIHPSRLRLFNAIAKIGKNAAVIDAFSAEPPPWVKTARHSLTFTCPVCEASPRAAVRVWINRRSPVYGSDGRRKWQEFYHCSCGCSWWSWSSDRPAPSTEES
ncbi:hypothetical protein [Synechococcus elongatus]|uniref:hypothetical protein n=1 Tax=Synechococcus elongatus TaxID=32046 RepID=UPI0030D5B767